MTLSDAEPLRILFVLPVAGGGGGAHSVAQEAAGLRRLGADARVAVWDHQRADHLRIYADLPEVADLFVGFADLGGLAALCAQCAVVVATLNTSVALLAPVLATVPQVLPACYAQDYEPWFFPDGPQRQQAAQAYALVPGLVIFAKTGWLAEMIAGRHGVEVHRIPPSVDRRLFYPAPRSPGPVRVVAMVRPSTPRRRAAETMTLLAALQSIHGSQVAVTVFGVAADDPELTALPRDFPHRMAGVLTRPQVADLLRDTDIFVDLSAFQAFGRTAVEAMACGAVALVPLVGGAVDYAVDGVNAVVVDTLDHDLCLSRLADLIRDPARLARMQGAARVAVAGYDVEVTAQAMLALFRRQIARRAAASAAAPPASGTT